MQSAMKPGISVVIPLYNKEAFVRRALNSVLTQKNWVSEIIVVNDGSTDNSVSQVEALNNPCIRIIETRNLGASHARNTGIKLVKSDYVMFLDADDYVLPGYFEEVSKAISDNEFPDIVATKYAVKKNGVIKEIDFGLESGIVSRIDNYFETCNRYKSPLISSNVCIKKKFIEGIGMFPEGWVMGEDQKVWIESCLNGRAYFINKPLAVYSDEDPFSVTKVHSRSELMPHIRYVISLLNSSGIEDSDIERSASNFVARGYLYNCLCRNLELNQRAWHVAFKAFKYSRSPGEFSVAVFVLGCQFLPGRIRRKLARLLVKR